VITPSFSPSVFDYYVRCAAGTNAFDVSMTASDGASSSVVLPATAPLELGQTLSLTVNENQAIVAVATSGSMSTEYWVRCLPHDFPWLGVESHPDAGTPPPGYYLVGSSAPGTVTTTGGYAMALNRDGVPVWYGASSESGINDVDSVLPGTISFIPNLGKTPFVIDHLAPWETRLAAPSGETLDPHELRALPNGHFLVIADPIKADVDLTGVHVRLPAGDEQSFGPGSSILDCHIVEFEPTSGKVVWSWVASEHFDPARDTVAPEIAAESTPTGEPIVEPFHCNSIDVDPENGNLLVSARDMSSVFYIEKATGRVLWKMGGAASGADGAVYVHVDDPFYQQHDARFVSWSSTCGGSGQISLFDDHSERPGPARGVVLDVVVGSMDAKTGQCVVGVTPEATVRWQYRGTGYSFIRGSFRITPDGSRVIGWGNGATPNLVFTEVDEKGADLLDFYFLSGNDSYRAIKVPLDAFDLDVLRRTAGR
jgi:hypothetical protein